MAASGVPASQAGTARTFRYPGRAVAATIFALMWGIVAAVMFSVPARQSGWNAWADLAVLAVVAVPMVCGLVVVFRSGLIVRNGKVTIRRGLLSRTVDAGEIRAITLTVVPMNPGDRWIPQAELASGEVLALQVLSCGPAGQPPKPERLAALNEFRGLVGLSDDGASK